MSIIDVLIGSLAPYDCLGCQVEGALLCRACIQKLTEVEELCYRCQRVVPGGYTCLNCPALLYRVRVSTAYAGTSKMLIWQLKLNGTQSAARIMARRMVKLLENDGQALIVPVPTATSRIRQRGYDQARLLARAISRQSRLEYVTCLVRSGQTHQHGAPRRQRLQQLENSFRVKKPRQIKNARIILVDDVVTTGATLEAAANALKQVGASRIEALVFARP